MRSSDGDALLHIQLDAPGSPIRIESFGSGANAALSLAESYLGVHDVPPALSADVPAVAQAAQRFAPLRLGASRDPYHELLPAVLGQRITAAEAARQWRRLCVVFGRPAPHVEGAPRLWCPPDPADLSRVPYWRMHSLGIERRRAETLIGVARHAKYLDTLGADTTTTSEQFRIISGIGQWTAAVAGLLALGDSDALCVGDFHAKNTVVYAFTGRHRGTDEEMCNLLAPFSPHRARVLRWLELAGWKAPAHGPRRRNLSIARF